MIRRPPRSTPNRTLFPYTTLFRSGTALAGETVPETLVQAFRQVLTDRDADPALVAQILTLPREAYLAEQRTPVDVDGIHAARQLVRRGLARALREPLLTVYRASSDARYSNDARARSRRSLKNRCLDYLLQLDDTGLREMAFQQFRQADNMTDELGALQALAGGESEQREHALERFYQRWQNEPLVVDKWFSVQALAALPSTLLRVRELLGHPAFNLKNPNKVRSLISAFGQNQLCFHAADGSGYDFLAEQIIALNALNPQIAARLLNPFTRWRKFDRQRQELMRGQLRRILGTEKLSPDVYEIAAKSLDS